MLLQTKALYNLIQLNLRRIEAGELNLGQLHHWQIANYRELPSEDLFQQLNELAVPLKIADFELYSKNFEAPEEMVEALAQDRKPLEKDQIYLILFELWRRFFPEKRTLSIFCDELDYQMVSFDLDKPNEIADALSYLQQLLEEHVDQGLEPHLAMQLIQTFCANDIESFLFDYILSVIEENNRGYAIELLDGFRPFVKGNIWFGYLAARAEILDDPEEGFEKLEALVTQVNSETDLSIVEEMLFFLANSGNHTLFYTLAKKTIPLLKYEEDLKEFFEACYAHYDYLELKQPSLAIAFLFHSRTAIQPHEPISPADPALLEMQSILDQKLHFAEE